MARTYDNIADAISAVNSEVSSQSSKIADILTALQGKSGGGGGLPSSITKIDGGSFTTSSTTAASAYRIEHNLGEIPQGFFVWCEEEKAFQTGDKNYYLIWAVGAKGEIKTSETATQFYNMTAARRNTTGSVSSASASPTSAAQLPNYATSTDFCAYKTNDLFYRSGYTYNWIAWA